MTETGLDMGKVMILFQRRYNYMREIDRLTGELAEAMDRSDDVADE